MALLLESRTLASLLETGEVAGFEAVSLKESGSGRQRRGHSSRRNAVDDLFVL
jgi:hypothetical protein